MGSNISKEECRAPGKSSVISFVRLKVRGEWRWRKEVKSLWPSPDSYCSVYVLSDSVSHSLLLSVSLSLTDFTLYFNSTGKNVQWLSCTKPHKQKDNQTDKLEKADTHYWWQSCYTHHHRKQIPTTDGSNYLIARAAQPTLARALLSCLPTLSLLTAPKGEEGQEEE